MPPVPPPVPPRQSTVTVVYPGNFALISIWKIKITANGMPVGAFDFKKAGQITFPVQPGEVHLHAKFSFRSADMILAVHPGMNPRVTVDYDPAFGSISFRILN